MFDVWANSGSKEETNQQKEVPEKAETGKPVEDNKTAKRLEW